MLIERIAAIISKDTIVLKSVDEVSSYKKNCEIGPDTIQLVVKVANEQDILAILALAQELCGSTDAFSVFPISTGRNWGYNSSTPNAKSVLLDLGQMTNIRMIDTTLGLVAVEPGVSQKMLRDFLDKHNLPFMVPVTGAGPECSILGNALERGYGITPYTDHFGAVTAMRVLLADGSVIQSAVAELDQSEEKIIDHTYKYGLGPYLDGLWTQSNLAITTEMTVRLKSEPEAFEAFYIQFKADTEFEIAQEIVFAILRDLEGVVGSVNMMDRRRVASMMAPNPNGAGQHKVMTDQQVAKIAKEFDIPAWTIAGTLYGKRRIVNAAVKEVKSIVAGRASKLLYSSSLLIKVGQLAVKILPGLLAKPAKMLASLEAGIEVMRGKPNQVALPLCYWRNPNVDLDSHKILDPAKDGCGIYWYAPLVPMCPKAMRNFIEHIREICPKYGIEPMITLTSLKHDWVDSTIPIVFNLEDPIAVTQAQACLAELMEVGLKQGWVSYRLNIHQQAELLDANTPFWQTVNRVKQALDPNNIISPGRYNPR